MTRKITPRERFVEHCATMLAANSRGNRVVMSTHMVITECSQPDIPTFCAVADAIEAKGPKAWMRLINDVERKARKYGWRP